MVCSRTSIHICNIKWVTSWVEKGRWVDCDSMLGLIIQNETWIQVHVYGVNVLQSCSTEST